MCQASQEEGIETISDLYSQWKKIDSQDKPSDQKANQNNVDIKKFEGEQTKENVQQQA